MPVWLHSDNVAPSPLFPTQWIQRAAPWGSSPQLTLQIPLKFTPWQSSHNVAERKKRKSCWKANCLKKKISKSLQWFQWNCPDAGHQTKIYLRLLCLQQHHPVFKGIHLLPSQSLPATNISFHFEWCYVQYLTLTMFCWPWNVSPPSNSKMCWKYSSSSHSAFI